MKKVCFFPFTHMDDQQVRTMDYFFEEFSILDIDPEAKLDSTLAGLEADGRVKRMPVPKEQLKGIEDKVRSYRDWAALHKGNERNLKALMRESTYLKDDSGVTAIQSGIRQGVAGTSTDESNESSQKDPLLFLKFAQIHDLEHQDIDQALDGLDENNAALFAELKGEVKDTESAKHDGPSQDLGAVMTHERIDAWCKTAVNAGLFEEDGGIAVLATTSRAVMDYMITNSDEVINGLDIDSIKVHEHGCDQREQWHRNLNKILDDIMGDNKISGQGRQGNRVCCPVDERFKLCLLPQGDVNKNLKNPGWQIAVCLVELNS